MIFPRDLQRARNGRQVDHEPPPSLIVETCRRLGLLSHDLRAKVTEVYSFEGLKYLNQLLSFNRGSAWRATMGNTECRSRRHLPTHVAGLDLTRKEFRIQDLQETKRSFVHRS